MAYRKVTAYEQFDENPFVERALQEVKIVKRHQIIRPKGSGEIQMVVSQDGEVQGHTVFMRMIEMEEQQFAKMYIRELAAWWELSKPAIRVMTYLIRIMKPKQDKVIFHMDKCLEYTGYKHPKQVLTGIADLIEAGLIARSNYTYEYFINPLVIFNGDRVTWAKTILKRKKEKGNADQLQMFSEAGGVAENPGGSE